jgi:hypothetical protein
MVAECQCRSCDFLRMFLPHRGRDVAQAEAWK